MSPLFHFSHLCALLKMRLSHLIFALASFALLRPCGRAQTPVLVLSPSPAVTVAAGSGTAGFAGDGNAASSARLAAPAALARDAQGNTYLADTRNHRVRRVSADGTITTVAGNGTQGFAGDGGPATQAEFDSPSGVAILPDNTLVIADTHNHRVRRVDASGIIHTIAGSGVRGYTGDGGPAVVAQLNGPSGLAVGIAGDLYIADTGNHCIRHLSSDGTISTVAGDGSQDAPIEGAIAIGTHLNTPVAVAVRADGSVLVADRGLDRALILQTDGTLHTVNTASLMLRRPVGVATNSDGDTLIADSGNYRVAQVSASGAGSALGSSEQGLVNTATTPSATALGAPAAVFNSASSASPGQIAVLDRDSSQLLHVDLPRLSFPDTLVGLGSTIHSVLLRNGGGADLTVTSVSIPTPFGGTPTSTCGSTPFALAANASCQIDLAVTPQTVGPISGLLQVNVANGLAQRITLFANGLPSGTQLTSTVTLQSSGTLTYAGMPLALTAAVLGSSTAAPTGTVTFLDGTTELGTGPLNSSAQASFNTSALSTGGHTLTARYNGDVHYLGSVSKLSPVTVSAPPDFTMSASTASPLVLHSGNPGALSATLQPVSGVLNRVITIAVDGLPSGTTLNITPIPVTLASDPVTVSIAFKLPVSLSQQQRPSHWRFALLLPGFFVLRRRRPHAFLLAISLFMPFALQGCGGGYLGAKSVTSQTTASTYPVTVTATCTGVTGATLIHTAVFTVEVQP